MYASVHSDTPVARTIISNNMDPHEALLVCILSRSLSLHPPHDLTI